MKSYLKWLLDAEILSIYTYVLSVILWTQVKSYHVKKNILVNLNLKKARPGIKLDLIFYGYVPFTLFFKRYCT